LNKYDNSLAVKNFYRASKINSIKKPHDRNFPSTHHVVPTSRLNELEYYIYRGKFNITLLPRNINDYYHWLFVNLTPPEIASVLVNFFWRGQIFLVKLYLQKSYFFNSQNILWK